MKPVGQPESNPEGQPAPSSDEGYPREVLGRPSKKAAAAAIEAHIQVLEGGSSRAAIGDALEKASGLGGQERRFVAFATRELSRHQRYLDQAAKLLGHPVSGLRLTEDQALVRYALWRRFFTRADWARVRVEAGLPGPVRPRSIPDAILEELVQAPEPSWELGDSPAERAAARHSFPRWLAEGLAETVPETEVDALFAALNREPELILRARPPGTRDEVVAALASEGVEARSLAEAPDALAAGYERKVFDSRAMKGRRLQVMELGSQLIALECEVRSGMKVVDLCAGAGGKTLYLADLVGRTGQVWAADKEAHRLKEGRRRVKEMGLSQVRFTEAPPIEEADVVLIDAPCSGSGTLAREPEAKWRLSSARIAEFAKTQRGLLESVAGRLRPGAALVYATCSLLRAENEGVVGSFLSAHPELQAAREPVRVFPHRAPGAGFFAHRMVRRG